MTILSETCRFILKHFYCNFYVILLLLVNVGVYIVLLRLIYKKEKRKKRHMETIFKLCTSCVPEISELAVKSKLPSRSGIHLEAVEPHP